MKTVLRLLVLLALLLGAAAARAQLMVPAGSTLTVADGATLHVAGAVQNAGTVYNQGTVQLTGHLTSSGQLPLGSAPGQWRLVGSSPQQLTVAGQLSALEVLNPQGAQLLAPLVLGQLSLAGGALQLGSYSLTIAPGGSISNDAGVSGRFIITDGPGQLLQDATAGRPRLFPVGPAPGQYAPLTVSRTAGTGTYAVRVAPGVLSGGSSGTPFSTDAVDLHWELTPADAVPFGLTVQWKPEQELSAFNRNKAALSRWTGSSYAALEPFGASGGTGSGPYTRTVSGLTTAGPYVVLDQQAPLPVELVRFEARRPANQPQVLLSWATASEKNNAGFEVQRQDEGQTTFRRVGFVTGRGTTSTATTYTFTDANSFRGLSYYRLRQLDQDGTETFTQVRVVSGLDGGYGFSLAAYPNPVAPHGILTLEAAGPVPAELQLALYAADGRLVRQLAWPAGASKWEWPVAGLSTGAYWLRYHGPDDVHGTLQLLVGE